jgi:hypothetical protein
MKSAATFFVDTPLRCGYYYGLDVLSSHGQPRSAYILEGGTMTALPQPPHPARVPWEHSFVKMVVRDPVRHKLCGFSPGRKGHGHLLGLGLTMYLWGAFHGSAAAMIAWLGEWQMESEERFPELVEFGAFIHNARYLLDGFFDLQVIRGLTIVETGATEAKDKAISVLAGQIKSCIWEGKAQLDELIGRVDKLIGEIMPKDRTDMVIPVGDNVEVKLLLDQSAVIFRQAAIKMAEGARLSREMDDRMKAILVGTHAAVSSRPECLL